MSSVNDIKNELMRLFPDAKVYITTPKYSFGIWTLDLIYNSKWVVIQGQENNFGVSLNKPSDDIGYGEGPDAVFHSVEEVIEHTKELMSK